MTTTGELDEFYQKEAKPKKRNLWSKALEVAKSIKDRIFGINESVNKDINRVIDQPVQKAEPTNVIEETRLYELAEKLFKDLIWGDTTWEAANSFYSSEVTNYFLEHQAHDNLEQLTRIAHRDGDVHLIDELDEITEGPSKQKAAKIIYEDLLSGKINWSQVKSTKPKAFIEAFRSTHQAFFDDELLNNAWRRQDHAYLQEFAVTDISQVNNDFHAIVGYCQNHDMKISTYCAKNLDGLGIKALNDFLNNTDAIGLGEFYLATKKLKKDNKAYSLILFYNPKKLLDIATVIFTRKFWKKLLGDIHPNTLEEWITHASDAQLKEYMRYLNESGELEFMKTASEGTYRLAS